MTKIEKIIKEKLKKIGEKTNTHDRDIGMCRVLQIWTECEECPKTEENECLCLNNRTNGLFEEMMKECPYLDDSNVVTNGDLIRQQNNKTLALFLSNIMKKRICKECNKPEDACETCRKEIELWLEDETNVPNICISYLNEKGD